MEPIFPFDSFLILGGLAVFLLIGVFLRSKIGFFQRFLIPSCLIGGFIAMTLRNIGLLNLSGNILETFIYHLFNISFISIGLTPPDIVKGKIAKGKKIGGPLGMGLLEGITFPLQAIVGGLITMFFVFLGFKIFPTFGFLSPLGFTEGPGQALSLGKSWEEIAVHTYANATTIGLTFAAIGFFFAFFVGVPLVNWGIKKNLSTYSSKKISLDFQKGLISRNQEKKIAGLQTTHPANIDSLTFHAALVGMIFVITYLFVKTLTSFLPSEIAKTLWGFFFFFGMTIALAVRVLIKKIGLDYLQDIELQKRITGWSVDFLIVATIATIEIPIVLKYVFPITIIAITTGVLTLLVVMYVGKRIWENYTMERIAGIFGTVTGTVPSGLLLIRILDPHFKTPAALDLGLMSIFASPFILIGMVLVNAPVLWGWGLDRTLLAFLVMMVTAILLIKIFGLWGKPKF